jgi:hypothetical protein
MLSMVQDQIFEYHNLLEYTQKLEGQLCSLNQEKDEKDAKISFFGEGSGSLARDQIMQWNSVD